MSGFALNNAEYDWIYWHIPEKKQSAEYDMIILSVSDAVYSIRSLNSLSNYQDRHIHCQTFKIMHFAKRIMPECRCTTRNFSGQEEGFVERRHFDKHFIKNTFFPKSGNFFLPSSAPVNVAEMHQYPWICLNILENGWINHYVWIVWVLNMSDYGSIHLSIAWTCPSMP